MKKAGLRNTLFEARLPGPVARFLRDTNPWGHGEAMKPVPPYRRWLFDDMLKRLKDGLAPVTVLRCPRQVGKTTLQEQIIEYLLNEEKVDPERIFRVQFDEIASLKGVSDPILTFAKWVEGNILQSSFNEFAKSNKPVFIFFDEAQNLDRWAPQIKSLVDHHVVRVLVTGSSALDKNSFVVIVIPTQGKCGGVKLPRSSCTEGEI